MTFLPSLIKQYIVLFWFYLAKQKGGAGGDLKPKKLK